MIDNSKEYIAVSAIWYLDYPTPENLNSNLLPINCDKGIVFCGHRHVHCLRQMNVVWERKQFEAEKEIQGFLTSKNRFVGRNEAAKIARDAGQLNDRIDWTDANWETVELYSEDIYHNYAK